MNDEAIGGAADPVGRILVVDDTPANLEMLEEILERKGHEVFLLPSGAMALKAVARNPPDLILLDITMPEMDGYETCRNLRQDPATADIPVIFLSALQSTEDKVRAFQAGGVDYISKPFRVEEVHARVGTHLSLSRARSELRAQRDRIRDDLVKLQELEALKNNLVHMVVHDMRSPLMSILLGLQMIEPRIDEPQYRKILGTALSSAEWLRNLVTNLLDLSRLEEGRMPVDAKPVDLRKLATDARNRIGNILGDHSCSVLVPEAPVTARCDTTLMDRILHNLLSNSLKFAPAGTEVRIAVSAAAGGAKIEVSDDGPGIPPDKQSRIFEKFSQAGREGSPNSSGLGLCFCKHAMEVQGGSISFRCVPGEPTTFTLFLPVKGAAD